MDDIKNTQNKQEAKKKTSKLSGVFMDNNNLARDEFYNFVRDLK